MHVSLGGFGAQVAEAQANNGILSTPAKEFLLETGHAKGAEACHVELNQAHAFREAPTSPLAFSDVWADEEVSALASFFSQDDAWSYH